MGKNKVVARFKNGSILKGNTSDFLPNKNQFHLETENGDIQIVDVDQLKAIFFVRDFTGNKDHVESYEDDMSGAGRKISVKFSRRRVDHRLHHRILARPPGFLYNTRRKEK